MQSNKTQNRTIENETTNKLAWLEVELLHWFENNSNNVNKWNCNVGKIIKQKLTESGNWRRAKNGVNKKQITNAPNQITNTTAPIVNKLPPSQDDLF